ncbi:MAG: LytTR family DNA-binding domain-containing protein [Bacteroidota bacterium]|nr:LytTR family DNA-binding domain-containing protein [Bacteroidota bacterium]
MDTESLIAQIYSRKPEKKTSCIMIDDEESAKESFKEIIREYFTDRLVLLGTAGSVKDGVNLVRHYNPDIIFLNIELPIECGFKLFNYFPDCSFEVIFTTSFKHYTIEAIKYSPIDYLLKPIDYLDLKNVMDRYEKKMRDYSVRLKLEKLLSNLSAGADINQKVALPITDGFQMEKINDIMYCEGDLNYSRIHTSDERVFVVSRTLKEIEGMLDTPYFFRIHKSYLINMNYVKMYSRNDSYGIFLENNEWLPVSTRRKDEFVTVLTNWRNNMVGRTGNVMHSLNHH